jgi:hypothetical protein
VILGGEGHRKRGMNESEKKFQFILENFSFQVLFFVKGENIKNKLKIFFGLVHAMLAMALSPKYMKRTVLQTDHNSKKKGKLK